MNRLPLILFCCSVVTATAENFSETFERIRELRRHGAFSQAERQVDHALTSPDWSPSKRAKLAYEKDLIRRIRGDFPWFEADLFARLSTAVAELSRDEFKQWIEQGRFESRDIDGERRFTGTSVSNLFWRDPSLEPRRLNGKDRQPFYRAVAENTRRIKTAARTSGTAWVLPEQFVLTMTVTVKEGAVPAGEPIRAWLPIPREYPYQTGFRLLASSSPSRALAGPDSPIRSIHLQQSAAAGPIRFEIKYQFERRAVWQNLRPEQSQHYDSADPVVTRYTQEVPHVQFTESVRSAAAQAVGQETNPVRKAKAIFDWVAAQLHYSFALEYSTIPNISAYSLERGYGDCGQQALVFITLCRQQGIPARWQSGWFLFPGAKNIHDWAEIYLPPWGWVPVDVDLGNAVYRYGHSLSEAERREARDFYFGGLDQYRMAANSDHSQTLVPAKTSWRSDDVDFQRGELEWNGGNIYFDDYSYSMTIE